MHICAVIPFYNEEKTIAGIINSVLQYTDFVIAVNDGSTDSSAVKIQESDKVKVISIPQNHGKGYALNCGFEAAVRNGADITITIDADMQHPPEYIPALIEAINNYDVVIGNRLADLSAMPLQRRMSNKITSYFLSKKTKQKILDSQCGYRAYKTSILPGIIPASTGYEAESEILLNAARKGYKIGFVNIPTIYGEEESKMKALQAIKGFIKVLFM